MIRTLYWHRLPSKTTLDALPLLRWAPSEDGLSPSTNTAALMLWIVLHFCAEVHQVEDQQSGLSLSFRRVIARASYDELSHAAGGVSRRLVGDGLDRLEKLGLLTKVGSHQHRRYELTESDGGWFKLPCQAIVRNGVVVPFQQFKLRSQVELFALKVYLYLAARRSNLYPYSLASYEKISKGTGVSERNIRQALVFLQLSGLLQDVRRERNNRDEDKTAYGPNIYYLNGHASLSRDSSVDATQGSEHHGLGTQEPPDVPQRKPRAAPF